MRQEKFSFWRRGVLILFILFFSESIFAQPSPLKHFDHPRLIETGELIHWINSPQIRIVDMRTSLLDYIKGHLPNAVYLNFEALRMPSKGIPAQLPDRICLERLLGDNLCLSNSMAIVLYSEHSNPNATFLAWILDYLGHKRVGILNGGWEKWLSERLPITQDYPSLIPNKFFGKVINETLAEKSWVLNRLRNKNVLIVDARLPSQYSGEEGEEVRRGHIPGAINLYWEMILEGGEVRVWKKKEELETLFSAFRVNKDKEIIVYCRTGREASHLYFTLKYVLGFPHIRLYKGSWVEWSADKNLPVKIGNE